MHPFPDLYGSDRMLLVVADAFRRADVDVTVFVPEPGPLLRELEAGDFRVEIHPYPVLRRALLAPGPLASLVWRLPADLWRMRMLLGDLQPDLIYVNTATLPHWLLAARIMRIPTVCHVREAERQLSPLLRRMLVAPLRLATQLIANSNATSNFITETDSRLRRKTTVVINGFDLPDAPFPSAPRHSGRSRIAVVGRLSPRKGQDLAIQAIAELVEAGHDVELELAGDVFRGYEWYREALRTQATALRVEDRVTFTGLANPVWPVYQRANIVAVPSRLAESFGNVAVEASAAGRPVVAARIGGLDEIVEDGVTGLLYDPDDAHALALTLERLLQDPRFAEDLAIRAAHVARERFSMERFGRDLLNLTGPLLLGPGEPDKR